MHPTGLSQYLKNKAEAMRDTVRREPDAAAYREDLRAVCTASDVTGLRRIQIRDWEYLSDSEAPFGGWNLAPTSPEYLLGVLSSCLCHTYLIGATNHEIALERVEVAVTAQNNDAHFFGIEQDDPKIPYAIEARITAEGPEATAEELAFLAGYAERNCPLVKILRNENEVRLVTNG